MLAAVGVGDFGDANAQLLRKFISQLRGDIDKAHGAGVKAPKLAFHEQQIEIAIFQVFKFLP